MGGTLHAQPRSMQPSWMDLPDSTHPASAIATYPSPGTYTAGATTYARILDCQTDVDARASAAAGQSSGLMSMSTIAPVTLTSSDYHIGQNVLQVQGHGTCMITMHSVTPGPTGGIPQGGLGGQDVGQSRLSGVPQGDDNAGGSSSPEPRGKSRLNYKPAAAVVATSGNHCPAVGCSYEGDNEALIAHWRGSHLPELPLWLCPVGRCIHKCRGREALLNHLSGKRHKYSANTSERLMELPLLVETVINNRFQASGDVVPLAGPEEIPAGALPFQRKADQVPQVSKIFRTKNVGKILLPTPSAADFQISDWMGFLGLPPPSPPPLPHMDLPAKPMPPPPPPEDTVPDHGPPAEEDDMPSAPPAGTDDVQPLAPPAGTEDDMPSAPPAGTDDIQPSAPPAGTKDVTPPAPPAGADEVPPLAPPAGPEDVTPPAPPGGTENVTPPALEVTFASPADGATEDSTPLDEDVAPDVRDDKSDALGDHPPPPSADDLFEGRGAPGYLPPPLPPAAPAPAAKKPEISESPPPSRQHPLSSGALRMQARRLDLQLEQLQRQRHDVMEEAFYAMKMDVQRLERETRHCVTIRPTWRQNCGATSAMQTTSPTPIWWVNCSVSAVAGPICWCHQRVAQRCIAWIRVTWACWTLAVGRRSSAVIRCRA